MNEPEKIDPRELSPLALAFVGDSVLELLVRQRLVELAARKGTDVVFVTSPTVLTLGEMTLTVYPPVAAEGDLNEQGLSALAAAGDFDPETLGAIALATDVGYLAMLFGYLLLFVVGGYLLYSAMFAAVGSAVDNAQDAAQLQTPIMIPIILAVIVEMSVLNDPNSPLAFWFSLIPFTSPVVMMARIPYGIPTWEIVLSLVLLYAAFVGMVWLSAKIYRVGIFMYGKKPTLREMFRWIRYKY